MVTIIICVVLAYGLKETAEDVIRTWRGDPPPAQRTGLRGAIEHGWNALADRHQRAVDAGHISKYGYWKRKWHLSREKALAKAGFETKEEIARAAAEHQHRLGFIAKGIDPDTMPPLFPPRGQVWEPPEAGTVLEAEPEQEPEPVEAEPEPTTEPGVTIDGHYYDNVQVWLNPEYFPPEPEESHSPKPEPTPQDQPWDPFKTSSTDTKETHMSNNGEINGPADVKAFSAAIAAVITNTATVADNLVGSATELSKYADELKHNIAATDTAAGGLTALELDNAAAAVMALREIQETMREALATIATIMNDKAGLLKDQAGAAGTHIEVIDKGYQHLIAMQEARAAAGKGNVHKDTFLDAD